MAYLNAFLCGGLLCAVGQILIDRTRLTPARILTGYVVAGVFLSAVGLYQPLADWGGAGATVPLTGFGHALAKGVEKAVAEQGWLGVLTGGLSATAGGITTAVVSAVVMAMAQLFDVGVPAISKHLKNIFESGELDGKSVISKMETTASDGKNYDTAFYNLDAIISVGYRVNSVRATQFRQWCTFVLRQFAIRGYVLDHKRMENGAFLGVDYFEHLLAEIREIRLSERRFYQKLTDIYATAIDYNKDAPTTRFFFKKVQNKMHYAVHGHTAAELIVERADANKEHMGLTTWENAPNGKIVKTDVSVAKNYLREKELEEMGRIVNASLDMAESMAKRHIPMTMEDWAKRIDKFINLFESSILQDSGKVPAEYAKEFAESEFEKYRIIQDRLFQSDFDRFEDNSLPPLDME